MPDETENQIWAENAAKRRNQLDGLALFDAPSVPSPTSEAAADDLTHTAKGRARRDTQNRRVLSLIASRESGYTSDELDVRTGYGSGSICARIDDLRTLGYIDTSETIKRLTRRHKNAAVHFVTASGRRKLEVAA